MLLLNVKICKNVPENLIFEKSQKSRLVLRVQLYRIVRFDELMKINYNETQLILF